MDYTDTRHHYIPQFYLRGFSIPKREDNVWVYDHGKKNPYAANVSKVGQKRAYYTAIMKDGTKDARLEKHFGDIESNAAPVIRKLLAEDATLSEDEHIHLMSFAAHIFCRVPRYREWMERFASDLARNMVKMSVLHSGRLERQYAEWEAQGKEPAAPMEEFRNFILDDDAYTLDPHPNLALVGMVHSAVGVLEHLLEMKWVFIRPREASYFITSDNPYTMIRPGQPMGAPVGLAMNDIEVTFPLGSGLCMVGRWDGLEGFHYVNHNVVTMLNYRTLGHTHKYAYAGYRDEYWTKLLNMIPTRARAKTPAPDIAHNPMSHGDI